ncbi:MAG: GspH/FimT family pseudopilin [Acidobacteria bacterium]|nr:GspH/FimT family pseudopilin [Acidobacteriota bacterium]
MARESAAGLSLIELLLAMSLTMAAAGVAVPAMFEIERGLRLRAATSFAAGYLQHARLEAIRRSKNVGVRFRAAGDDWVLGMFADTNGNGIRTADILSGVDAALETELAFSARASQVRIGRLQGVPDVNGVFGGEAVRFGAGGIASFDADGSASSGSLYLTDARTQIAITVTPATGRVRVRQWERRLGQWRQIR